MSTFPKTDREPAIWWPDDESALERMAERCRIDLGNYTTKTFTWLGPPTYLLSNFYYELWTYYLTRLKLLKDYGHDIDEPRGKGFLDCRAA